MTAVSQKIHDSIILLQSLPALKDFALAGGTNLSLRYNHRVSIDIDLFSNIIVGSSGLESIKSELIDFYKENIIFSDIVNTEIGEQYCFLKVLIRIGEEITKVEVIQNIQLLKDPELFKGVRLLSVEDIGILKLLSASSRKAKKDIYDLDLITDNIPLANLFELLVKKEKEYKEESYKSLFDLDKDPSPTENIALLLEFDNIDYTSIPSRPSHSNDRIDILPSCKSWLAARSSWRKKVRDLMRSKGIALPGVEPIN